MNSHELEYLKRFITLQPLLKDKQRDRIKILISGKEFIVQNDQLKHFPETLLGNDEKRRCYYDNTLNLYRFNRHPSMFESILYYYLSPGILIRPPHIEPEIFCDELRFWNIDEKLIEEGMMPLNDIRILPVEKWRRIIWKSLTYPESIPFPYDKLVIGSYMLITLLSCIPFMAEIIPTITELNKFQQILAVEQIYFPLYLRSFYIIEIFCIVIFSIELNLRIISAPTMAIVLYDKFIFLDLIILLSSSLCLISYHLHNIHYINNLLSFYHWLVILKSLRIYRLVRYMLNVRLLYKTIVICMNEVCTLIILVTFFMILFGTMIYIFDNSESESNTRNILDGFWLAFITLTTLGYGDVYPRSFEARISAGLCALIGIIIFSMPTTIIFLKYTTLIQNRWKKYRSIHYRTSY